MNPVALWLTKTCQTFPMEITKEGAQSLRINAKCWVVFERSYSCLQLYLLAARLPELTSKLERLDCSHMLNSEHRSKLSTDYSSGERWYGIVEVQFVEKTGAVATIKTSEGYFTACKCCLSIFTKIKLLIINTDSSMVFSVVVLLLKYNFCLRNIFWCLSPKNSLDWDFVYFTTCFVNDGLHCLISNREGPGTSL